MEELVIVFDAVVGAFVERLVLIEELLAVKVEKLIVTTIVGSVLAVLLMLEVIAIGDDVGPVVGNGYELVLLRVKCGAVPV